MRMRPSSRKRAVMSRIGMVGLLGVVAFGASAVDVAAEDGVFGADPAGAVAQLAVRVGGHEVVSHQAGSSHAGASPSATLATLV